MQLPLSTPDPGTPLHAIPVGGILDMEPFVCLPPLLMWKLLGFQT
jgi:hypothetical protein